MDVVESDFAFMPNKLDLIRDIALGTDNAERKAYSNNKYGLVEYSDCLVHSHLPHLYVHR